VEVFYVASSDRKPTVIIIGSGFAGLCLGYHLGKEGIEYTILEKADSLGGTWRDNSYPGAACDVPSISYCFSFAQKTDWSRKWSPQAEILEYMNSCADDFGIREHIRFGTEVASASFDEDSGIWTVRTTTGEELTADFLVSGVGQLHRPSIPDIPGRDEFSGPSFHSARWQHDVDLAGKTVAVIGNAASAIQFIPQIAKTAACVKVIQRSSNWMVARNDREYSEAEKQRFARHPWLAKLYRWRTWAGYEAQFPVFAGVKFAEKFYRRTAEKHLEEKIPDPAKRKLLTPDYPVGAKRILISDDYYDALMRDNVELLSDGIERITASGVVTGDGQAHEADVIIFATGFTSTQFLVPMEITGRNGQRLEDVWREGAEAYLGVSVAGFPNFFMMYGPNTNLGHNSIIFMLECQAGYIMNCIREVRAAGADWLDLSPAVQREYNDALQETLERRVWSQVGSSWYKNAAGRITNNWAGSTVEYWWRTRRADMKKYTLINLRRRSERSADGDAPTGDGSTRSAA
jgi:cation diffusion facilitator CzcD-associated flavoprotein CzcO